MASEETLENQVQGGMRYGEIQVKIEEITSLNVRFSTESNDYKERPYVVSRTEVWLDHPTTAKVHGQRGALMITRKGLLEARSDDATKAPIKNAESIQIKWPDGGSARH